MWLEMKYVGLLSPKLRNFKKTGTDTWNFSCPICGDSEKHVRKARGYLYPKRSALRFYCHNCGAARSLRALLQEVDRNLYDEYILEKLADTAPRTLPDSSFKTSVKFRDDPLKGLDRVSDIPDESPCRELVLRRRIPAEWHDRLYACPNFFKFTNGLIPEKFSGEALDQDHERLLIPFVTDGRVHAYTGRSLGRSKTKYVSIVLDVSVPKIFGTDHIDRDREVLVFEGPIDAMFLQNSVAVAGGDLTVVSELYHRSVLVFDNEPRNVNTVRSMLKAVSRGYSVCVWPSSWTEKDVNDMVLAGKEPERVRETILRHAYQGLEAEAAVSEWRVRGLNSRSRS